MLPPDFQFPSAYADLYRHLDSPEFPPKMAVIALFQIRDGIEALTAAVLKSAHISRTALARLEAGSPRVPPDEVAIQLGILPAEKEAS